MSSARAVPEDGPRQLVTVVRYTSVPASDRAGPLPLIVFSQGFAEPADAYAQPCCIPWAAAGFVVAAPTYPRTNPDAPGGPDESDILNHPADLRYVIGAAAAGGQIRARRGVRLSHRREAPIPEGVCPGRTLTVSPISG